MLQVVPAEYAFVVHTANPITKVRGEVFGELVVGMGEALVGNYPGRALSFSLESGKASTGSLTCLWNAFAGPAGRQPVDVSACRGCGQHWSCVMHPLQARSEARCFGLGLWALPDSVTAGSSNLCSASMAA